MTIVGAVFLPQLPPERLRAVALAADESGLDELWLWEDCFREGGMTTCAAALAWTERLRVGVGVFPVPLRNVALTAMEVASLTRMFGDRAVIGIGHGVADWMTQVGAGPASPMTLMREYATALGALLAGERVATAGRYVNLDDVALDWPPPVPPKLHMAGVGPKTLALAGELTDGVLLSGGATVEHVRQAAALGSAARAAADRPGTHGVGVYVAMATGPDSEERMRAEMTAFPMDVGYAGDADELAAVIRDYAAAGAERVICQPTSDEPDPEGFMRFVATELAPRVRAA
jgi:alkanesulfonate monooxygenase SsuD/methylene tetrahydromethanopterin reductase-like flavin-dependent oxidoreductase (luciferase family)